MHVRVVQIDRCYKGVIYSLVENRDIRLDGLNPVRITIQVGAAEESRERTGCTTESPALRLEHLLVGLVHGSQKVNKQTALENLLLLLF